MTSQEEVIILKERRTLQKCDYMKLISLLFNTQNKQIVELNHKKKLGENIKTDIILHLYNDLCSSIQLISTYKRSNGKR